MKLSYDIADVAPYINWAYFYFAWQVKEEKQQRRMRSEAEEFLASLQGKYHTYALFRIVDAYADGDDIVLPEGRIPLLRQQHGSPCLCLSDFIGPKQDAGVETAVHGVNGGSPANVLSLSSIISNRIGLFATSADKGLETDFDADPYQKMMAQLLADRLAEATAELVHEAVRKHYWGYAPDELLSVSEMQQEYFQGIRPAVGYPSLPDASLNFLLDELLDFSQIGITLTENGAMRPHASVSGLMLAHPQAHYFAVGKIAADQLNDYARRRGLPIDTIRKFLSANL